MLLASAILLLHIAIIAFNIFGLLAIPLGAWRGWAWVRYPAWRLLHLGSLAIVAIQAAFGQACFLTIWHDDLTGADTETPLIMGWINDLILWPLPMWVFTLIYGLILLYVVALMWLLRPDWRRLRRR